ncbi:serine hydrolase [uncultured Microscilla sp.]|uniref:serine hydrolase domain-containing protein n=1 Tax=uncultured Microscilla sp. TaxID=432653 RepID=UPI002629E54E|nr:serine hydrolase domain-containing protein [uncultured Microscilla sp.]
MKNILLRNSLGLLLVLGLIALIAPYGVSSRASTTLGNKIKAIDGWLKEQHKKGAFNGTVLIVQKGKTLLMKGYGYTNYRRNKKLTPQSSLRLASVSKQFTAAGIMRLHQKGLLKYDAPLSKYFKNFPYPKATVRQLLTHTSGIPDVYMELADKHDDLVGEVLSIQEVVKLLTAFPNKNKAYKPNERFQYCNTGYVLLAAVIEKVSGESFEAYMKKELFDPLKMKNTRVWNLFSAQKTFANKTTGFWYASGKYHLHTPSFLDGVAGDGAVFSSVEDFVIWDKFWYGNSLISPQNLKEAFKPVKLNNGKISKYGFGWQLESNTRVSHTGSWLGARTAIVRDTKAKVCLVVLDNSTNKKMYKIMNKLKDELLE